MRHREKIKIQPGKEIKATQKCAKEMEWGGHRQRTDSLLEDIKATPGDKSFASTLPFQDLIFESVAEGILVLSNDWKIINYNQKFLKMWRIPQSIIDSRDDNQAIGFVLEQLKDAEGFMEKAKEIYSQPDLEYYDILEFKDGRIFERYSHPYRKGGKCIGRVVSFRDITGQRRAEESLKATLSLHRATIESTTDGILVVDCEGRIVSFNQKFVEMWRVPQLIIDSRDDNQALTFVLEQLKDPIGFLAKVREVYAQRNAESFDVIEFKDGRIFERYSLPQRISDQTVGRVWSFRDVTERRRAEDVLQKAHNELEKRVKQRTAELSKSNQILKEQIAERKRAEEALRHTLEKLHQLSQRILQIQEDKYKFISRELHDNIAQSLNAIKMRLERLKLEASPTIGDCDQEIHEAVSQLRRVSQEVRNLSKQMRPEILDELGLIATLQAYIRDFQKRTGLQTEFIYKTIGKVLGPDLETHLYRIVQEALSNVFKHARASYAVIRLEMIGKHHFLSVVDNGIGFASGKLAKTRKGLRGIGLVSIQERVNLIKATLDIESSPGNGTRITVKVPVSDEVK
jgi:signal transduction histidine kinase